MTPLVPSDLALAGAGVGVGVGPVASPLPRGVVVLAVLVGGLAVVTCLARAARLAGADRVAPPPGLVSTAAHPTTGGPLAAWWAGVLSDSGVEGDPKGWARVATGGSVLLAVLGAARAGPAGAAVALIVAGVGLAVARQASRGRGARRADALLPALVEHVARALRAGEDLRGAASGAGRLVGGLHGRAVGEVVGRVDGGATWDDALGVWSEAHPRRPVQLVAGALAVADAAGGRAGPALDGVAATLRARTGVADEARALASQARASAAVLVGLPVVVAVGGAAADPKVADALLGTPWGLACIALAVLLDGTGALWMHRVVAGAER